MADNVAGRECGEQLRSPHTGGGHRLLTHRRLGDLASIAYCLYYRLRQGGNQLC